MVGLWNGNVEWRTEMQWALVYVAEPAQSDIAPMVSAIQSIVYRAVSRGGRGGRREGSTPVLKVSDPFLLIFINRFRGSLLTSSPIDPPGCKLHHCNRV